ncbi:MAG: hypothetical protein IPF62_11680 [Bacteroidetes bacterium]|nr:hypothetical protein [Bacteroidota bacterium]
MSPHNLLQYDLDDNTWFHVAGLDTSYQNFRITAVLILDLIISCTSAVISVAQSKQMSVVNNNPDVKEVGL